MPNAEMDTVQMKTDVPPSHVLVFMLTLTPHIHIILNQVTTTTHFHVTPFHALSCTLTSQSPGSLMNTH